MNYQNNKVTDIKIAYIGGGSRGWAWTFMTDLALEEQLSGTVRLYDIDQTASKNNEIIGNRLMSRADVKGKWQFQTVTDLSEALSGCDFVIISILPGTFQEMESDVHLPERLGIYQSVGDTTGPGGIIRALRTIPMLVEIANAVEQYAPNAWVINYTNPMSLCIRALYHTFPEIKAFGCCHEVFGTQKVLAGVYQNVFGKTKIDWHDIYVNVLGINHFTWFSSASYRGIDLFPIYEKFIEEHFEDGVEVEIEKGLNKCFLSKNRVKMDLFKKYGWIAAAGDRHLAEFMNGNLYLKDPHTVQEWGFELTTVNWRKQDLKLRLERSERMMTGKEDIPLESTGEEGILLIKALCGLSRIISNVNIPNTNRQIKNLPENTVVETNALFEKDHIYPIMAGELPKDIYALMQPHVENQDLILQAAICCDKELVVKAFLNDPLVNAKQIDEREIRILVDDMIRCTMNFLPDGWR